MSDVADHEVTHPLSYGERRILTTMAGRQLLEAIDASTERWAMKGGAMKPTALHQVFFTDHNGRLRHEWVQGNLDPRSLWVGQHIRSVEPHVALGLVRETTWINRPLQQLTDEGWFESGIDCDRMFSLMLLGHRFPWPVG